MNSIFKLSRSGINDLVVTGLEYDNGEYLDESTNTLVSVRNYAYSHSVTVNILSYTSLNGSSVKDHAIVMHLDECTDESVFKMDEDGLYEVSHIIIPNKTWYDYCNAFGDKSGFDKYKEIYIYDDTTDKIVKYINGVQTICSIEDLINIDDESATTVIKSEKSTFNIQNVRKCHADICSKILNAKLKSCRSDGNLAIELQKRDILFMAISSLRFAIDTYQFYEAQRILESIKTCVDLCEDKPTYHKCNCK